MDLKWLLEASHPSKLQSAQLQGTHLGHPRLENHLPDPDTGVDARTIPHRHFRNQIDVFVLPLVAISILPAIWPGHPRFPSFCLPLPSDAL